MSLRFCSCSLHFVSLVVDGQLFLFLFEFLVHCYILLVWFRLSVTVQSVACTDSIRDDLLCVKWDLNT